jgi:hypothetical protein
MVNPVKLKVSIPPSPVLSVQVPPVGLVAEPHAEFAPTTASKPVAPSMVTVCAVAEATNLYHTASSVPFVQSPVSLLSVAPTVDPVVVLQLVLDVKVTAAEQVSPWE